MRIRQHILTICCDGVWAHPAPNTLFVQIGDADLDNTYWGGDHDIPTPRTSYQINATSPGTDAAAQAAAAFAACSALYANRALTSSASASLANTSYATTLLNHAQQLYTSPPMTQSHNRPIKLLYLRWDKRNSSDAYTQAVQVYQQQNLSRRLQADPVSNWDEKTPAVALLGLQIKTAYPNLTAGGAQPNWQSDLEGYFDRIVNGSGRGYLTGGGLLYYPGDSDEASLNPALNAAMLLMRYADSGLPSTSSKHSAYIEFAQNQVDYVLGNNPMTVPYIVGMHPNSPANPHSALATGASPADIANIDTVPTQEAYVLYGGVVGGPDAQDRFWDMRSDWVQNEVALDYVAPVLTLAARAIVEGTSDPWYTRLDVGSNEQRKPGGQPCDAALNVMDIFSNIFLIYDNLA
ncbi:hypothetical protein EW026_g888 [Hermanssonia centrifuga]|uniref:cellulase n=1 Tax=Hermanssonia centrifuga TaxID=98765 RepID=A0A4V3XBF6_9APHY|nr:hypothetical protein EW026_g888 [Hermanssonia centrifuga]